MPDSSFPGDVSRGIKVAHEPLLERLRALSSQCGLSAAVWSVLPDGSASLTVDAPTQQDYKQIDLLRQAFTRSKGGHWRKGTQQAPEQDSVIFNAADLGDQRLAQVERRLTAILEGKMVANWQGL